MCPTWDERFAGEEYFYGTEPNEFLAAELPRLSCGRGLFLGEGEGRNAVHAARLGHEVLAVDASAVGRNKALRLAHERGVALTYLLGDVTVASWDDRPFDFAGLVWSTAVEREVRLDESNAHRGLALVNRLVGVRA